MAAPEEQKKKRKKRWNLFKKRRKKGRDLLDEEAKGEKQKSSPNRSDVTASSSDVNATFARNVVSKNKSKRSIKTSPDTVVMNRSSSLEAKQPSNKTNNVIRVRKTATAPGFDERLLPKDTPTLHRAATTESGFSPTITEKSTSAVVSPVPKRDTCSKTEDPNKKTTAFSEADEPTAGFLNEFDPFEIVEGGGAPSQAEDEQWNSFMHQFPNDSGQGFSGKSGKSLSTSKERPQSTRSASQPSALKPSAEKPFTRKGVEPGAVKASSITKSDPPGTKPTMEAVDDKSSESFSVASSFRSVAWDDWDDESARPTNPMKKNATTPPKKENNSSQKNDSMHRGIMEGAQVSSPKQSSVLGATNSGVPAMASPKASPRASLKSLARAKIAKDAEQAKELRPDNSLKPSPKASTEQKSLRSATMRHDDEVLHEREMVFAVKESGRSVQPPEKQESRQSVEQESTRAVSAKVAERAVTAISTSPSDEFKQNPRSVETTIPATPSDELKQNSATSSSVDSSAYSLIDAFPKDPMMDVAPTTKPANASAAKAEKEAVAVTLSQNDVAATYGMAHHQNALPLDEPEQAPRENRDERSPHVKTGSRRAEDANVKTPSESTWTTLDSIPESNLPLEDIRKSSSFEVNKSKRGKGRRRSSSLDLPRKGRKLSGNLEAQKLTIESPASKQTATHEPCPPTEEQERSHMDKYACLGQEISDENQWVNPNQNQSVNRTQAESLATRWSGAKSSESELGRPRWTTRNKLVPLALTNSPPELTDIVSVQTGQEGEVETVIPGECQKIKAESTISKGHANSSKYESCHSDSEFNTTTSKARSDGSWTLDDESTQETDASRSVTANSDASRATDDSASYETDDSKSYVTEDSRSHCTNDSSTYDSRTYDSQSYVTNDSGTYDSRTYDSRSYLTNDSRTYDSRSYMTNASRSYVTGDSRSYMTGDSRSYMTGDSRSKISRNPAARTSLTKAASLRSYLTKDSRSTNASREYTSDEESSSDEDTNKEEAVDSYLWEKIADTLILGQPWKG